MSLFSALVKVGVDIVLVPVALAKDVVTLGNVMHPQTHTGQLIDQIRKDSEDADK